MFRLIMLLLLLFASLLCLFRAPQFYAWYAAILVTEFPWIFIGITLLLLFGLRHESYRLAGTITGILALLLFSLPIVGAYRISRNLGNDINTAFGASRPHNKGGPFKFWKMITGINAPVVIPKTFVYRSTGGIGLNLDFYPARLPGKRPCVIVVHGGSWSGGDNKQLPELNSYLAIKGYQVAAIDYRLAPQYLSPAPVQDVHYSLRYLRAHADELDIDTNRFILLGRSAGAQVVLVAAYTLSEPGLRGVINFYGPSAMVWGYGHPASRLVFNSCRIMETYLGGTYQQVPEKYAASSPADIVPLRKIPTLTIHGKNDPLVAYGHVPRLDKKLVEYGIPHYTLTLPWATHACDYTLNGPSGQLSTHAVERFLEIVTK